MPYVPKYVKHLQIQYYLEKKLKFTHRNSNNVNLLGGYVNLESENRK